MNLGTASITALYLGPTAISTVYLGSTQVYSAGGAFSPLSLFASGEEGAWYDPSDLTTMWTDTAGTIQATAVLEGDTPTAANAVARIDDKSGNGNHATQITSPSRPYLTVTAGGLYYLSFDGTDDFMTSGTNADWKYLHDGTGAYVGAGITATDSANPDSIEFIFATNDSSPTAVGFYASIDDRSSVSRNEAWNVRVSSTTSSPTPIFEATNSTVSDIDGNLVFSLQHGSSQTPDFIFRDNGSSVYSVNYGNTPSTANSETALYIGNGGPTPTVFWSGSLYNAVILDRLLTTDEITNTEAYLATRSGVTL